MEKQEIIAPDLYLSITTQRELLSFARINNYYKPRFISERDKALMDRLDEIFTDNPVFGSRQLRNRLQKQELEEGSLINQY